MSIYRYLQSNVVDEVVFRKSPSGAKRAYIHAKDDVPNAELAKIEEVLKAKGFQCTPYSASGKFTLEVRNFDSETQVIAPLVKRKWIVGEQWHQKDQDDKFSLKDKIKKRSLWASAASFVIADTGFIIYGHKEFSPLDAAGGFSYLSGTLASLMFSRKDPSDIQIRDLSKKMAQHIRQHDFQVPKDSALAEASEDHTKNPIKKVDNWLRKYPSEAMNLIYVVAGACIATAAYKEKIKVAHEFLAEKPVGTFARDIQEYIDRDIGKLKKIISHETPTLSKEAMEVKRKEIAKKLYRDYKREGWMDVGLGTTTMASGLFGALVKEKGIDPDQPKKHGIARAWEWMRERPLTISAIGYMGSTACHAVSTSVAWASGIPRRRKSVPFRAAFIAFTTIGEILLAISSKGHGEGVKSDSSIDDTVVSMAAEIIAHKPQGLHNAIIGETAKFIASPSMLAISDQKAEALLREKVELMRKNPWAVSLTKTQQAANVQDAAAANSDKPAEPVQHAATERAPKPLPGWQAKVAKDPSAPQPQLSA